MSLITKMLRQKAVYWPPAVRVDLYGRRPPQDPVEIKCRWEPLEDLTIRQSGDAVAAHSRIFVSQDVAVGGWLWLGALEDAPQNPVGTEGACQIIRFRSIPDRRIRRYVRMAFV